MSKNVKHILLVQGASELQLVKVDANPARPGLVLRTPHRLRILVYMRSWVGIPVGPDLHQL